MTTQDFKPGMILKSTTNGVEMKVIAQTRQGLIDMLTCECLGRTLPNITADNLAGQVNSGKLTIINA